MRKAIICLMMVSTVILGGCSNIQPLSEDLQETKKEDSEVDLSKYFVYSFSGYDGQGSMSYEMDYESMLEDYEILEEENYSEKKLAKKILPVVDIRGDISNGQEITISWDLDVKDIEKDCNLEFIDDDFTITVEGLEVMPEYDPFEYLEVTYEGVEQAGYINLQTISGSPIDDVTYSATKTSNLSNGDIITITASCDEETCLEQGYQLTSNEKEYTVEGLYEYVMSTDQITDEILSEMFDEALDEYYASSDLSETEELQSADYAGYYFLTAKAPNSTSCKNYCYIIINVKVNNPIENLEYYYWVGFTNILVDSDGNCTVDLNDTDCIYGGKYPYSGIKYGIYFTTEEIDGNYYWYVGYRELDSLYSAEIQPYLADYNVYDNTIQ